MAPQATRALRGKSNHYTLERRRPAAETAAGRRGATRCLSHVNEADADTVDVAETAARAHRPLLAEPDVHPETEGEIQVVVDPAAERRDEEGLRVRREGRIRSFELEPPAQRHTDRKEEHVGPVTELGAKPERQRAVERKTLAVAQHLGAEVAAEQDAGIVAALAIGEATPDAEIVGPAAIAVEALEREVGVRARVGERRPELMVRERPIRRLEERRAGLLRCQICRAGEQSERQDPT